MQLGFVSAILSELSLEEVIARDAHVDAALLELLRALGAALGDQCELELASGAQGVVDESLALEHEQALLAPGQRAAHESHGRIRSRSEHFPARHRRRMF